MSNVKAGDFAKIIGGSNRANIGKIVLVLRPDISGLEEELAWTVKPLQPMKIVLFGYFRSGGSRKINQEFSMHECCCRDKNLKRIDPPADGEELWRDEPIPSDTITPKEPQNA